MNNFIAPEDLKKNQLFGKNAGGTREGGGVGFVDHVGFYADRDKTNIDLEGLRMLGGLGDVDVNT